MENQDALSRNGNILNFANFHENYGNDEELLKELFLDFIGLSPELLSGIKNAIKKNDFDELQLNAHTLKSNLKTFGAMDIADLAFQLETMGQEKSLTEAGAVFAKLEEAVEKALQEGKNRLGLDHA